jgi:hypothetical protein
VFLWFNPIFCFRTQKFGILDSEPGLLGKWLWWWYLCVYVQIIFYITGFLFLFLAIYHYYGMSGRDEKKIDTKGIICDLAILNALTDATFLLHFRTKIDNFVNTLNEGQKLAGVYFFSF